MPTCGIEKLYITKQTADESTGMTFETPLKYYPNVQEMDIDPKVNTDQAYAENRLIDVVSMFASADIKVSKYFLTSAEIAYLLDQTIASNGGVVSALGDEPDYITALYKSPIKIDEHTTGYRYGVIYKILFTPPSSKMKGLEGKPDLSQTPELDGIALPTKWSFIDAKGKEKHPWEYHIDTTDPNCPENIDELWFNSVQIPNADTAAPTVTSVPLDAATGVLGSADIVFTFSKAMDVNTLNSYNIHLMKEDGTAVTTTISVDATQKIVTVHPSVALSAGNYIAECEVGVKSAAGIPLAVRDVVNFTVSA